jgi:GH24 family phage-related lysozyme (muramidase)
MNATLDLLRQFEGFRETPYWDVNALRAGYGSDTMTLADGSVVPVGKNTRVSRADAERDLARRVETEFMPRVVAAVGPDVFATLSDGQKAALGSITYNYGSLPSSVASAVQTGDAAAVANAINALGAHNEGVNKDRRAKEAAIYSGAAVPSSGGNDYNR